MSELVVCEIFKSIQGESSITGYPCSFVRLASCNLSCNWCDTRYALSDGVPMSSEEIIESVKKHGTRIVEITGGEPLLVKQLLNSAGVFLTQASLFLLKLTEVRIFQYFRMAAGGS